MPTPTYDLLASTTLATAASSVTFSSIDQSYGDLVIAADYTLTAGRNMYLRVNGDTGSNYSDVSMFANGSSKYSFNTSSVSSVTFGNGYATKSNFMLQCFDYSATDKHKTFLSRMGNANNEVWAVALRWANNAAITSLTFISNDVYVAGSTFNLYGVAK